MSKKQIEIWCSELWMDWDDVDVSKDFKANSYGPSVTNSFYDLQDPDDGYILRGVGAVCRPINDREHDYY